MPSEVLGRGDEFRFKSPIYETEEEAKKSLEEYIESWEMEACIERGPGALRLHFGGARIVDKNPKPDVSSGRVSFVGMPSEISGRIEVKHKKYPSPTSRRYTDETSKRIYKRYMNYKSGKMNLTDVANYALTEIEDAAGGKRKRNRAAKKYKIPTKTLNRIGCLADRKGGEIARKAKGVHKELSKEEKDFLDKSTVEIIRKIAEYYQRETR